MGPKGLLSCIASTNGSQFEHGYNFTCMLGKGATGGVYLAQQPESTNKCAVKVTCTDAPSWQLAMAHKECQTLSAMGWGNVHLVRPIEVRLTPSSVQLVLHHCSGGTLESYVKQHRISEDMACYMLHQLIDVLEHLHSAKIAYRDFKLQNVLLESKPSRACPPKLVLCDLGTVKHWEGSSASSNTIVGTPGFMAPQVLASMFSQMSPTSHPSCTEDADTSHHSSASKSSHAYDACKADIWAVGALLHYMLHRHLPYGYDSFAPLMPPHEALLILYQLENKHTWQVAAGAKGLQQVSPEAQDLLDQLLHPDEAERINIKGIKQHPWFNRPLPALYANALSSMKQDQEQLNAACSEEHQRCRQLAADAINKLFQLSKSSAVLQQLRQQNHCLSVPLACFNSRQQSSSSWATADAVGGSMFQQRIRQLVLCLTRDVKQRAQAATAASAEQASLATTIAGRCCNSSIRQLLEQALQQLQLEAAAAGITFETQVCSSKQSQLLHKPATRQDRTNSRLEADDTCFLVRVNANLHA